MNTLNTLNETELNIQNTEAIEVLFYKNYNTLDNCARVTKRGQKFKNKYIAGGGGYDKEGFALLQYLKENYSNYSD